MRGMTFGGDRTIEYIELPDPVPGSGEVVLEMKASGICGSDLHTYYGRRRPPAPSVLGHEMVGEIVGIGPGGAMDIESRENAGTCVRIALPRRQGARIAA